jgi:hypothetical protein
VTFLTHAIYSYVGNDVDDEEKTCSWLAKVEGTSRVRPSSLFSNSTEEVRRLEMDSTGLLRGAPPLKYKSLQLLAEGHRKRSPQKEENSRQQIRGVKIQKQNVEADDFPYNHQLIHQRQTKARSGKGGSKKSLSACECIPPTIESFLISYNATLQDLVATGTISNITEIIDLTETETVDDCDPTPSDFESNMIMTVEGDFDAATAARVDTFGQHVAQTFNEFNRLSKDICDPYYRVLVEVTTRAEDVFNGRQPEGRRLEVAEDTYGLLQDVTSTAPSQSPSSQSPSQSPTASPSPTPGVPSLFYLIFQLLGNCVGCPVGSPLTGNASDARELLDRFNRDLEPDFSAGCFCPEGAERRSLTTGEWMSGIHNLQRPVLLTR